MQLSSFRQHVIIFAKATALSFLAGCSSPISEIEQPSDTTPRMVGITTRSTADISYPITLYAFYSESGILAGKTTASSANNNLTLPLRLGSYHLVALAGAQKLGTTDSPTSNSSIGIPTNGIIESAVQLGAADITVSTTDVSVDLTMRYQVAQIGIELHDIPTDVSSVSVSLSSLYTDMTFQGDLTGGKAVNIQLSRDDNGIWKSGTKYTLPGSTTQLTLSISMTKGEATQTYAYTHGSNLEAGTPYTFIGSYIEGFYLTGSVTSAGWNEPQNINFTFGVGADAGKDNGGDDDDDNSNQVVIDDDLPDDTDGNYWVTTIPEAISIWNGHFVGVVTKSSDNTSAELLLISLQEWEKTTSEAITVQDGYTEGNIGNWRIPTAEEMITIASWGKSDGGESKMTMVNGKLRSAAGDELANSQNYLCEDGEKYVQISNDKANTAASDVTYRLRLVKTITVKIPEE